MELYLKRTYFPEGCNGAISWKGQFICASIELPWKDNQQDLSCIPEGRYALVRRYSLKFKWHLWVKGVKGRSLILIHPANDAQKELRGCIAPVSRLIGPGYGLESQVAMNRLKQLVYRSLAKREKVFINIVKP